MSLKNLTLSLFAALGLLAGTNNASFAQTATSSQSQMLPLEVKSYTSEELEKILDSWTKQTGEYVLENDLEKETVAVLKSVYGNDYFKCDSLYQDVPFRAIYSFPEYFLFKNEDVPDFSCESVSKLLEDHFVICANISLVNQELDLGKKVIYTFPWDYIQLSDYANFGEGRNPNEKVWEFDKPGLKKLSKFIKLDEYGGQETFAYFFKTEPAIFNVYFNADTTESVVYRGNQRKGICIKLTKHDNKWELCEN